MPLRYEGERMATLKFFCPECGKAIEVGDNLAGTGAFCPHCAKRITIPHPDGDQLDSAEQEQADDQPKLQLRSNKPAPNKPCPKCQAECEADAVICVSCGTDLRTGRCLQPLTTYRKRSIDFSGVGRTLKSIIPLLVLLAAILGIANWHQKANRAKEVERESAELEAGYSAITSKVSRSMADIGEACSDMQALTQKAVAYNLHDWKARCEEYTAMMERRKIALNEGFLSLSNGVASLELKGELRAAVQFLREYKGEFVAETADFRNKLATAYERKANLLDAEVRKAEEERQGIETERQKVEEEQRKITAIVRAGEEAAEKGIVTRRLREEQYAELRDRSIKHFASPVGRLVKLEMKSGGNAEGIVQAVTSNAVTIAMSGGAVTASMSIEQLAAETRRIILPDDYADGVVAVQRAKIQREDADAMLDAIKRAATTKTNEEAILTLGAALGEHPDAPNAHIARQMLSKYQRSLAEWKENTAKGLVQYNGKWMTQEAKSKAFWQWFNNPMTSKEYNKQFQSYQPRRGMNNSSDAGEFNKMVNP